MVRRKKYRSKSPTLSGLTQGLTGASSYLNLGIFAIIGLLVYKVYKWILPNSLEKAQNESEKQANELFTTRAASESIGIKSLEQTLKDRGLIVSNLHISQANQVSKMLDSAWIDDDKIVKFIQSMGTETFQLVTIAYKQRELVNYRNSHPFDSDSWSDIFSGKKMYGSMKYHLQIVLEDENIEKLQNWLKLVP